MLARDSPESPVLQLSINGTQAVGLLSGNLSPPSDRSPRMATVYVGDSRGVSASAAPTANPTNTGPKSRPR